MQSITIELNRFGDDEGILKSSEKYLRAIGNEPIVEAKIGLKQKEFRRLMKKLSYDRFRISDLEEVQKEAEDALKDLGKHIKDLLPLSDSESEELYQVDVVTNALELAQLPFEVIEETRNDIVLTRRVRQPWPRPPVVISNAPKVLFVWAEPLKKNSSSKRYTVPHDEHRDLLKEILADWCELKDPKKTLVEIGNATFNKVKETLQKPDHGFTHVYVLTHGCYNEEKEEVNLLLENEEGRASYHSSEDLKSIYENLDLPRPGTIVLSTCFSGEIDPLEADGTLGQVLHAVGIPVVLASQLALTKKGSSDLVGSFLAQVINGEDPRLALWACRDMLRQNQEETFYDRVALVGYVHLPEDFEEKLPTLKLKIALARLEAASKSAVEAESFEDTRDRFKRIRTELDKLDRPGTIRGKLLEELKGLKASSLKREAESAWTAAKSVSPEKKLEYWKHSRKTLREASKAYRDAARLSRDHHWTAVQSLVLDAVLNGTIAAERKWDWIAAHQAAEDYAANMALDPIDRFWGQGSLVELRILAPLVDESCEPLTEKQNEILHEIVESEGNWPLNVLIRQLDRYKEWWGEDDDLKLPEEIKQRAITVREIIES